MGRPYFTVFSKLVLNFFKMVQSFAKEGPVFPKYGPYRPEPVNTGIR